MTLFPGRRFAAVMAVLVGSFAFAAGAAHASPSQVFGRVPCGPAEGVVFCASTAPVTQTCPQFPVPCATEVYDPAIKDTRVPSWDGTPLDLNLALPPGPDRNLPLIIMIHGFESLKIGLDSTYNDDLLTPGNVGLGQWAKLGYAVLSYSSRGQGNSCGAPASRIDADCTNGFNHLNDFRYEIRDTEYLAGMLADEGIINPQKIGVMGGSWGGGESLDLATLRNRMMLPDGQLVPWVSPVKHLPMQIAAAVPIAAWSSIPFALVPNGHDLDYTLTPYDEELTATGVMKLSFGGGLSALLELDSYFPGVNQDPLAAGVLRALLGYPQDDPNLPAFRGFIKQMDTDNSPYYLPETVAPPPTLYADGWNDDIFTITQELNWVNRELSNHPHAPIAMLLQDFGHQRSQNKAQDAIRLHQNEINWFAHYLQGKDAPVLHGVQAWTTTCPSTAKDGGPYSASSWAALHPGEVRYQSDPTQIMRSDSSNLTEDSAFDPIAGSGVCATTADTTVTGTATYEFPVTGNGFTMIGSPTIVAHLDPSVEGDNAYPFIAAHLLVIGAGGSSERLLARQTYRPVAAGRQVFQLYPQAYTFRPGDVIKLELAGQDTPYSQPDTSVGSIQVSDLQLRLPVVEKPNCTTILSPLAPVVPSGETLAPGVKPHPKNFCATTT